VVLVLGFAVVAAVPILFLCGQRYVWVTRELLREELDQNVTLARSVADGLDRYMASRIFLIHGMARDLALRDLRRTEELNAELDRMRERNQGLSTLLVADTTGTAIAFSPRLDFEGKPNVGKRYADRAWFQEAIASPFRPTYDVVTGRAIGRPTVPIAAPLRRPDGTVAAVLTAALDLDNIRSLNNLDPARRDRLVLVDGRGRVIAHPSAEWQREARDLSAEPVFQAALRQPEGNIEYVSTVSQTRRWGSYARVPATGWAVWISREAGLTVAQRYQLVRDLAVSALAALVGAVIAGVVAAEILGRPLLRLAALSQQVAARRFDAVADAEPPRSAVREFAQLFGAFREMADELRARYGDLEDKVRERTRELEERSREAASVAAMLRTQDEIRRGYGELAALLNSLDRSHILGEGTKKIAQSAGAPLVAVLLTDDGPAGLRLKTYHATDPALLDAAALAPRGLPAEVVRRGTTVTARSTDGGPPLSLHTGLGTLDVAAVVGVPLCYQERTLGVLLLAFVTPPSREVESFVEDAGRQLSVALNNAGLFESVRYQSQELERLNADLRRASEVKSEFLAVMSHELRTPLNSIIGFSELLLTSPRDPLSDRQRAALDKVLTSGRHLLGLINEVLDLSKIEAGRMEVHAEPFPLAALVLECVTTMERAADAKGLTIHAPDLERAPMLVHDRAKVKQILLNLISNAVKFTSTGGVEIRVAVAPSRVEIAVADTGIGIAAEHHALVFEAFRQVDGSDSRHAGGTGLGLGISRRLAELLGGRLTLASRPGHGSTFTVELPLAYRAVAPADGASPPRAFRKDMVLVVDDDQNAAELVRQALADEDVAVDWVSSAATAVEQARVNRPAAVLLDVMLQGKDDGWDVLGRLKADPSTRDIPVIVYSVIDNADRARRLGAHGVLPKPAALRDIAARVRDVCAARRAEAAAS